MSEYASHDLEANRTRFWRNELRDLVTSNPWAFARIIKRKRQILGWTQRDLGRKVGISHQYVSFAELGNLEVGIGTVRSIMDALALTIDDLRAEIAAMYGVHGVAA